MSKSYRLFVLLSTALCLFFSNRRKLLWCRDLCPLRAGPSGPNPFICKGLHDAEQSVDARDDCECDTYDHTEEEAHAKLTTGLLLLLCH